MIMNRAQHKGLSVWVISAAERPEPEQTVGRNDLCGAPAQEKVWSRLQAKDEGVAPERCVTSSLFITPAGARAAPHLWRINHALDHPRTMTPILLLTYQNARGYPSLSPAWEIRCYIVAQSVSITQTRISYENYYSQPYMKCFVMINN